MEIFHHAWLLQFFTSSAKVSGYSITTMPHGRNSAAVVRPPYYHTRKCPIRASMLGDYLESESCYAQRTACYIALNSLSSCSRRPTPRRKVGKPQRPASRARDTVHLSATAALREHILEPFEKAFMVKVCRSCKAGTPQRDVTGSQGLADSPSLSVSTHALKAQVQPIGGFMGF